MLQQWSLLKLKLKNYRHKCRNICIWDANQSMDWKDKLFSEELESLDLLVFCPKLLYWACAPWSCGALASNQQQVNKKNMLLIVLKLLQGKLYRCWKIHRGCVNLWLEMMDTHTGNGSFCHLTCFLNNSSYWKKQHKPRNKLNKNLSLHSKQRPVP